MTGKAVVVFSFDEPEDGLKFPLLVKTAKEIFQNEEDVKIHAAVKDAAEEILHILTSGKQEPSNLVEHARSELERLGNDEDFNIGVLRVIRAFADMGHSGGSASYTVPLINDLLQWKHVTPLTDNPREWNEIKESDIWQSSRNPEAFSNDGGKTYYLLSEGATDLKREPLHESIPYSEGVDGGGELHDESGSA